MAEEDVHWCVKCQTTVVGLGRYISHRKSFCKESLDLTDRPAEGEKVKKASFEPVDGASPEGDDSGNATDRPEAGVVLPAETDAGASHHDGVSDGQPGRLFVGHDDASTDVEVAAEYGRDEPALGRDTSDDGTKGWLGRGDGTLFEEVVQTDVAIKNSGYQEALSETIKELEGQLEGRLEEPGFLALLGLTPVDRQDDRKESVEQQEQELLHLQVAEHTQQHSTGETATQPGLDFFNILGLTPVDCRDKEFARTDEEDQTEYRAAEEEPGFMAMLGLTPVDKKPGGYETAGQDEATGHELFNTLELQPQHREEERQQEGGGGSLLESLGLYWLNPADVREEAAARPTPPPAANKSPHLGGSVEKEELDCLFMLGLNKPSGDMPKKWRLWADELLAPDLYLNESAATDPTLMEEVQVQGMLPPPHPAGAGGGVQEERSMVGERPCNFCEPCGRQFASRELLRKHLMSELHFKKSSVCLAPEERRRREVKRPKFFDELTDEKELPGANRPSDAAQCLDEDKVLEGETDAEQHNGGIPSEARAVASRSFIECVSCKARVSRHQYGKHLISHYHYHRSMGQPENRSIILDNIGEIVRQAPFQCQVCRFYCNWHDELVEHCSGHSATSAQDADHTRYWCCICQMFLQSHEDLMTHLGNSDHLEIVSVINRSVPIVIGRVQMAGCPECGRLFRLRFSLRLHMRRAHGRADYQLPDHDKFRCRACGYFAYRRRALTAHEFLAHPGRRLAYNCYRCRRQFTSRALAVRHRSSAAHRQAVLDAEARERAAACCSYCGRQLADRAEYAAHMKEHYRILPQCLRCGLRFARPQELSVHVRRKCDSRPSVDVPADSPGFSQSLIPVVGSLKCTSCGFSTDLKSTLQLHELLCHREEASGGEENVRCGQCHVSLAKKCLRQHLVSRHGDTEGTAGLSCDLCFRRFEHREQAEAHMDKYHGDERAAHSCPHCPYVNRKRLLVDLHVKRRHGPAKGDAHPCDTCDKRFRSRQALVQRQKSHHVAGKKPAVLACGHPGCGFRCSYPSDLERHSIKHEAEGSVCCSYCPYRCKRPSELSRHFRLRHAADTEELSCADCAYTSRSKWHMDRHRRRHSAERRLYNCTICLAVLSDKEGVRKHVRSRHPGRGLYCCPHCAAFEADGYSEFCGHLTAEHMEHFQKVTVSQFVRNMHTVVKPD